MSSQLIRDGIALDHEGVKDLQTRGGGVEMREAISRQPQQISPLARDLALSRVRLAVLKALEQRELTTEEVRSTKRLHGLLKHELAILEGPKEIPPAVVPQDTMRQELQVVLGTLPHLNPPGHSLDRDLLQRLIPLLANLAEREQLSRSDAKSLLSALQKVGTAAIERDVPIELAAFDQHAGP